MSDAIKIAFEMKSNENYFNRLAKIIFYSLWIIINGMASHTWIVFEMKAFICYSPRTCNSTIIENGRKASVFGYIFPRKFMTQPDSNHQQSMLYACPFADPTSMSRKSGKMLFISHTTFLPWMALVQMQSVIFHTLLLFNWETNINKYLTISFVAVHRVGDNGTNGEKLLDQKNV